MTKKVYFYTRFFVIDEHSYRFFPVSPVSMSKCVPRTSIKILLSNSCTERKSKSMEIRCPNCNAKEVSPAREKMLTILFADSSWKKYPHE